MKIAIIGYGSMGSMLVNGFISTGAALQEEIIVFTKTSIKLEMLHAKFQKVLIAQSSREAAEKSEMIFICVGPMEVKTILKEIHLPDLNEKHIITIAGDVTIDEIEKFTSGPVTKIIPTITSEVREGITLMCHNPAVSKEQMQKLEHLFNSISTVKYIEEKDFEAAADFTSCAPGLFSSIFEEFVFAGLRHCSISGKDAEEMVMKTLLGTAKLYLQKNMNFAETINRVATKGGITEEGVKVLRAGLPDVFNSVFQKTLAKHESRKQMIRKEFDLA